MNKSTLLIGHTADHQKVRYDINESVYSRGLILASSGFGKSMLLRMLIELAAPHVQTIVIDPDGEFPSLREKLDILIVGGEGADINIDIPSAALLARRLAETGVSAVINLYDVPGKGDPWDKRRQWYANFMNAWMNLPKNLWKNVFMPVDEAHQFAPEGKGSENANAARSATRLAASQGRKHGLGLMLATQRISKIDKDSIADLRNVFVGGANLDIDIERSADMLGYKKSDHHIIRGMMPGEFFGYGPAFSEYGVTRFIAHRPITTHPSAGKRLDIKVPKASDKMHEIVATFGDLPAAAAEEIVTLQTLQRDNLHLQRQLIASESNAKTLQLKLDTAPKVKPGSVKIQKVVKLVLTAAEKKQIETGVNRAYTQLEIVESRQVEFNERMKNMMEQAYKEIQKPIDILNAIVARLDQQEITVGMDPRMREQSLDHLIDQLTGPKLVPSDEPIVVQGKATLKQPMHIQRIDTPTGAVSVEPPAKLPTMESIILQYAYQYTRGIARTQATVLSGYHKDNRNKGIRNLIAWGYMVENENLFCTEEGSVALARHGMNILPMGEQLRTRWLRDLSKGEGTILDLLFSEYPEGLTRLQLSEKSGYHKDNRNKFIRYLESYFLVLEINGKIIASEYLYI